MAILNPWSLELLLKESHQGEAISGTIYGRNEKYAVTLKTSRRPEQENFTYIAAEMQMRRVRGNMFSAQQAYQLTSQYGGDKSLRIILNNGLHRIPHTFFDITIDGQEISGDETSRTLLMPPGEFTPRPLLRYLCRILNLRYEEGDDSFYLPPQQQQLSITADTVKETYQRMKRSGYFPSLSCSSVRKGFTMFQYPTPGGVHQTLSVHVGSQFSKEDPLTPADIALLQKTLLDYCPVLPKLNYTWTTETAIDSEGWGEA